MIRICCTVFGLLFLGNYLLALNGGIRDFSEGIAALLSILIAGILYQIGVSETAREEWEDIFYD